MVETTINGILLFMTNIEKIKELVKSLSVQDLQRFKNWFTKFNNSKPRLKKKLETNDSPNLHLRTAREFYAIASVSFNQLYNGNDLDDENAIALKPIYYNLCLALEIAYKGFLLFKRNRTFGHSLTKLRSLCEKHDLNSNLFSDTETAVLHLLDEYHMTNADVPGEKQHEPNWRQQLRYGEIGLIGLPFYRTVQRMTLNLFKQIDIDTCSEIPNIASNKVKETILIDEKYFHELENDEYRNVMRKINNTESDYIPTVNAQIKPTI